MVVRERCIKKGEFSRNAVIGGRKVGGKLSNGSVQKKGEEEEM